MTTTVHPLQVRSIAFLPTIDTRQCCDLKIDTGNGGRWWLCRAPIGRTDHRITIEKYTDTGHWQAVQVFTDREAQ